MTIDEVESYYGKEAADWLRGKIADGTFKHKRFVVRLKNPKCKHGFLRMHDVIGYFDPDGYPMIKLPDHLRHSDTVSIEVEEEEKQNAITKREI